MNEQRNRLLFLEALTPVHAGLGRGFGGLGELVDLPVQRDEFGFPCIWASSLKGALRAAVRSRRDNDCFKQVFGPEPEQTPLHSSMANFLDARLLLIPARSLKGVWVYVTSPHLLTYLIQYLEVTNHSKLKKFVSAITPLRVPVSSTDRIVIDERTAVINEIEITVSEIRKDLVKNMFNNILPEELLKKVEERGIIVVDDDTARVLIQRSMLIQFRVRLGKDTKTVETGPWSEEYLPERTILVSSVVCRRLSGKVSNKCDKNPCDWLNDIIKNELNSAIWLGGKETIGRGFVKLYVM